MGTAATNGGAGVASPVHLFTQGGPANDTVGATSRGGRGGPRGRTTATVLSAPSATTTPSPQPRPGPGPPSHSPPARSVARRSRAPSRGRGGAGRHVPDGPPLRESISQPGLVTRPSGGEGRGGATSPSALGRGTYQATLL